MTLEEPTHVPDIIEIPLQDHERAAILAQLAAQQPIDIGDDEQEPKEPVAMSREHILPTFEHLKNHPHDVAAWNELSDLLRENGKHATADLMATAAKGDGFKESKPYRFIVPTDRIDIPPKPPLRWVTGEIHGIPFRITRYPVHSIIRTGYELLSPAALLAYVPAEHGDAIEAEMDNVHDRRQFEKRESQQPVRMSSESQAFLAKLTENPLDRGTWNAFSDYMAEQSKPWLSKFAALMASSKDSQQAPVSKFLHQNRYKHVYGPPVPEATFDDTAFSENPLYADVAGSIHGIPILLHHNPISGWSWLHIRSKHWPQGGGVALGTIHGLQDLGTGLLHEIDEVGQPEKVPEGHRPFWYAPPYEGHQKEYDTLMARYPRPALERHQFERSGSQQPVRLSEDERAFLRALSDNPMDKAIANAYADWLTEHGDDMSASVIKDPSQHGPWKAIEVAERRLIDQYGPIAVAAGEHYHDHVQSLHTAKMAKVVYGRGGKDDQSWSVYSKGWHRNHGPAKWKNSGARFDNLTDPKEIILENNRGREVARIPYPPPQPAPEPLTERFRRAIRNQRAAT